MPPSTRNNSGNQGKRATQPPTEEDIRGRAKGRRSEAVSEWYFRLNGFMSIHNFIVHIDSTISYTNSEGVEIAARTDADLMGVRFPNSREVLNGRPMVDDTWITRTPEYEEKPLFILVEVKSSLCRINGPWTNPERSNMQRVIRRLGFANSEAQVEEIADSMYRHARWVGPHVVLQYVCVGGFPRLRGSGSCLPIAAGALLPF